jgi:tetratricopeptide (TPR) repeat protein
MVGAEGQSEHGEVFDLLSRLVDKSLVVAEATGGGKVRYRMLEPVRQYAREKLQEGGEADEVRRQHAGFFLALAEEAEPRLRGPDDIEWLERLEIEHDNLRAALSWTLERGTTELGLRLTAASLRFWEAHGHFSEGRRWLEKALKKEGCTSTAVRAKALYAMSLMAHRQYDTNRAEVAAQEGLKLSAEPKIDGSLAASFRIMLGRAARLRGDFQRAKQLLEEGLKLSRDADDRLGIADALRELAGVWSLTGDRAKAKALYEEGIVLCRELGYRLRLGDFLQIQGNTLLLEGDYERGAALFRERGDKGGLLYAVDLLGWVALLQDDYARAKTSYQESLTLCKELGDERIARRVSTGWRVSPAPKGNPRGRPGSSGWPKRCTSRCEKR